MLLSSLDLEYAELVSIFINNRNPYIILTKKFYYYGIHERI